MVTLADLVEDGVICFPDTRERDEVLGRLVDALYRHGKITDPETVLDTVIRREKIVSTGMGMGIAVPHARLIKSDRFVMAIGIRKQKEGIEWGSPDGIPVRLVFMIVGPARKQTEYLQLLSSLTATVKDEKRRKKLFVAQTLAEITEQVAE
ncbi:MAG: PTS sugar transporter subunit IIA [Simkaniaceae bacterium]|nr:PTS sugar transporter subunit IIA [Simkaniaceae bacterium]